MRELTLAGLLLTVLGCGVVGAQAPPATDPKPSAAAPHNPSEPTDAELLEFLGTVDNGADSQTADDGSWIEYLAQTDPGKVARPPNGKPAPATPPPAAGDKNND